MAYNLDEYHQKILKVLKEVNSDSLTLIEIGRRVGLDHSQKVQNKLDQLERKGYIRKNLETKTYEVLEEAVRDIVYIPVFGSAQCGHAGSAIVQEIPDAQIPFSTSILGMLDSSHYFLIRANGDSMLPLIKQGDLVLIRQQKTYDLNDKILVVHNERPKIKKVTTINGKKFLISLNSEFDDVEILPYDALCIVGVVKKVISEL